MLFSILLLLIISITNPIKSDTDMGFNAHNQDP